MGGGYTSIDQVHKVRIQSIIIIIMLLLFREALWSWVELSVGMT
jgi:hypothetical protein